MTDEDFETVVPELPEGYFFRVTKSILGIYPWVQLRKKRRLGSSVEDEIWSSDEFPNIEAEVEHLMIVLSDRLNDRLYRCSTQTRLMGDYPPKVLNVRD